MRILSVASLIILFASGLKAQDKPNIILFFIDDWSWNGSTVQMQWDKSNSYFPWLLNMNWEQALMRTT